MRRLPLLSLILVPAFILTMNACAHGTGSGNSNQGDATVDGGALDGGTLDGSLPADGQVAPSGPNRFTLTNGGGTVSSSMYQGVITIGAPHPGGTATSTNHKLQTGQLPNR